MNTKGKLKDTDRLQRPPRRAEADSILKALFGITPSEYVEKAIKSKHDKRKEG